MSSLLSILGLSAGLGHILADYRRSWTLTYWLKPITMICFILLALSPGPGDTIYRYAIVAGLVLSLIGDVCLMLRPARFLAGLLSFLLAHLVYIGAFGRLADELWWPALPLTAFFGAIMTRLLWSGAGRLRPAVLAYIAAIVLMVAAAASAWHATADSGRLALVIGALLFLISDGVLGYARFRHRFPAAQAIILGTYYPAQWLIAASAGVFQLAPAASG
ncbi:MAG: lysoplasmalogenase [Gammaproteobacteria bacterium]